MITQTKTTGGATPDHTHEDTMAIVAAAQTLRSEAVGKYVSTAARYVRQKLQPVLRPVSEFFTRRQEMVELMRLNDRELADIGLSRGDLYAAHRGRTLTPANENRPRFVA